MNNTGIALKDGKDGDVMSTLEYELMKTTNGLSDVSMEKLIDYARTFIVPFDRYIKTASQNTVLQESAAAVKPRRLGSRKGVKFVADGHDIDDYNDEIEALFGVSD